MAYVEPIVLQHYVRKELPFYYKVNSIIKKLCPNAGASLVESDSLSSKIASIKVLAVVPPRYFSFHVESGGGSVQVVGVKEGSAVSIKTHGGSILGGNIQASEVQLNSGGGNVNVRQVTAAKVGIIADGGTVAITTLAGLQMKIENNGGPVNIGACFVEQSADIECGNFQAESWRGGALDSENRRPAEDFLINLTPSTRNGFLNDALQAVIGGVDGSLGIRSRNAAIVDLQINEGSRDVSIDLSPGTAGTVTLHVAPSIGAEVSLTQCGEDWQLPQGARARIDAEDATTVHAQLLIEHEDSTGPKSRLQRGAMIDLNSIDDQISSCDLRVRGAARVSVRRRSWMQSRQEAFRKGAYKR